jgi:hypothetical protein
MTKLPWVKYPILITGDLAPFAEKANMPKSKEE